MAQALENVSMTLRGNLSAEPIVKEVAANRAVQDLSGNLVSAGVPADTAQAVTKVVKEYLVSYPRSNEHAMSELSNIGVDKDSAKALLRSVDDALKSSS